MENGSFQHLNLSHLDFVDFDERSPHREPLTPQHQVMNFTEIPKDLRKSGTVEALISQNEDLMARLKVTLRRLTQMEDENKSLSENFENLRNSHASVSDQMLVWKEKERLWKDRHDKLESDLQVFQERFPQYLKMEAQIERLKKYQDKVKSTIKPYLQQLKDYAQSLHLQIQALNKDLDVRESQIHAQEQKITGLKEQMEDQAQFYKISQNELVSSFEKTHEDLRHEIQILQENNQALELRTQNLDRALERQDELENLVIALRRNKEDFQNEIREDLELQRLQNRELKQTLTERDLMLQDLTQERDLQRDELKGLHSRREEMEEQLTSLRYMWTSKSEENEKLKISLSSLERLNLELSSKLNELRKQV